MSSSVFASVRVAAVVPGRRCQGVARASQARPALSLGLPRRAELSVAHARRAVTLLRAKDDDEAESEAAETSNGADVSDDLSAKAAAVADEVAEAINEMAEKTVNGLDTAAETAAAAWTEPVAPAESTASSYSYTSYEMTAEDIKAALLDSAFGTGLGWSASSQTRAEINELIAQLEAKNPTPSPTDAEAAELLGGSWKLVYTSNSELLPILAAGQLPGIEVDAIYQDIDAATMTVENRLEISGPLGKGSVGAYAKLEIQSPKRVQVSFNKGRIGTPALAGNFEVPSSLNVMGNVIDTSPVSSVLGPLADIANQAVSTLAGVVSQVPDIEVPITAEGAQGWLLTTYLDEDLRISRGDLGSVFVLMKEFETGSEWEDDDFDF